MDEDGESDSHSSEVAQEFACPSLIASAESDYSIVDGGSFAAAS